MNLLGTRHSPFIVTQDLTDLNHRGLNFEISSNGSLLSGQSYTFVGVIGAIPVHFYELALNTSSGPATIELIENPTISVQGTLVIPTCKNRVVKTAATVTTYKGATITGGSVLGSRVIYPQVSGARSSGGENAFNEGEWVLNPGDTYAI